jgi:hypothetical protein
MPAGGRPAGGRRSTHLAPRRAAAAAACLAMWVLRLLFLSPPLGGLPPLGGFARVCVVFLPRHPLEQCKFSDSTCSVRLHF